MRDKELFPRSALILIIACGCALFALSILLYSYKGDPVMSGDRIQPGTYSISAIGYGGLYDTLRRLDRPAKRAASNALSLAGANGTLVIGEPDLERITSGGSLKLLRARRLLVILPKWRGIPHEEELAWVSGVEPVPLAHAKQTLYWVVRADNDVFRKEWPSRWSVNEVGISPTGSGIVQLIRSTTMRPVVGDSDGMLVGEIIEGKRKIWILSDPDVLSNHGIFTGDNAAFMLTLMDQLRLWENDDPKASIVFDESVHGFQEARWTPLRLLFSFPFAIVTLLLCCSAALWVMAGANRFGAPIAPKRPLDFGKATLIYNSARLLDYAGHHPVVLKRYVRMTVHSAGQLLHAPPSLDDAALAAWLDTIGKANGVTGSCAKIMRATNELNAHTKGDISRLFESAWNIYCWKGELFNESGTHRRNRKKYQD